MKQSKTIRCRVMEIAWQIYYASKRKMHTTGKGLKEFGYCLMLAWRVIHTWNGQLNEVVTISHEETVYNLNGHARIESKILEVVIR